MGFMSSLTEAVSEGFKEGMGRNITSHSSRRPLTEQDFDGFRAAADERPKPRTIEDIRRRLTERNFVRMNRLQKEYRWMQREMKKMGLNPEDARWVL